VGEHGEEDAVGNETKPTARWTDRCRAVVVAIELLTEGARLLADLFGRWPW